MSTVELVISSKLGVSVSSTGVTTVVGDSTVVVGTVSEEPEGCVSPPSCKFLAELSLMLLLLLLLATLNSPVSEPVSSVVVLVVVVVDEGDSSS